MPFIDSKISVKVSDEKKDIIKARFGQALSIIGKPESFLMVGIDDEYTLYFAGNKLEKGAYISVDVLGSSNSPAAAEMTAEICKIFGEELDIPAGNIYVEYRATPDWGWNGSNF